MSRSSSGLAQVSNLGDIQITCRVPARPFPTKPGESHNGLRAATTAYKISPDGSKELVGYCMATAKVLPRYHLVISGGDRSVCQGGGGGVGERVGRGRAR